MIPTITKRPHLWNNTKQIETDMNEFPAMFDDWLHDPNQYGIRGIVTNNDIDGITSAMVYSKYSGLPIIGLFDYKKLWIDPKYSDIDPLTECAWLDSDVLLSETHSIGNHTTMISNRDYTAFNSINVNDTFNIHGQSRNVFRYHYTGSTLLLLHAFGMTDSNLCDDAKRLILYADSTWNNIIKAKQIGMQSQIESWLRHLGVFDSLRRFVPDTDSCSEYGEFIRLRRRLWNGRGFTINNDGNVKTGLNIGFMAELLKCEYPSILKKTLRPVMKFDGMTGMKLDLIRNVSGRPATKTDLILFLRKYKNMPESARLFAVTFTQTNKIHAVWKLTE